MQRKNKGESTTNKFSLFLLLTINVFLFSLLILHWYTANEIKNNFSDFSKQVKEKLKSFSEVVGKGEEELRSIQKEINGLAKTIEELNAIERELKKITANLGELGKTGEELKEAAESIKSSLNDLGELREKVDELTKLEFPLIELEKTLSKGGEGLEKEIKEKIGGLLNAIKYLKKLACSSCFDWNFKFNPFSSSSISLGNVIEERKWKDLFKTGKLIISGNVETVKYSSQWWWGGRLNRDPITKTKEDITIEKKNEIKKWKDKEEDKQNGDERKEFIFQEAHCKDCGRKLDLKNFTIKKLREEI